MFRQPELVHRLYPSVDDAKNEISAQTLSHNAGSKPAEIVRIGEIGVPAFFQLRFLKVRKETIGQRCGVLGAKQRYTLPDRLESAIQPPDRRSVYSQMHVGRTRL